MREDPGWMVFLDVLAPETTRKEGQKKKTIWHLNSTTEDQRSCSGPHKTLQMCVFSHTLERAFARTGRLDISEYSSCTYDLTCTEATTALWRPTAQLSLTSSLSCLLQIGYPIFICGPRVGARRLERELLPSSGPLSL